MLLLNLSFLKHLNIFPISNRYNILKMPPLSAYKLVTLDDIALNFDIRKIYR